jgi:hypothetical protein
MKVRKCASCGAPLGEIAEDATSVPCEFCGAVNEPTIMQRGVHRVHVVLDASVGRTVRRATAAGAVVSAFVGLVTLAGIGAGIFGLWTGLHSAFPQQVPRLPGVKALTPAKLAELLPVRDRQVVEVAAPAGGYALLDPVAQIPWALAIAQGWAKDARLERIDVTGLAPHGLVDASRGSEGEVMYRFVSPARIEQYWKEADVRTDVRAQGEMWVIAKGGGALVQTLTSPPSRGATVSPAPSVLRMADLLERSRSRLPPRPYYKGYMIFSGGEGWVWYLSTLSGRESIPRIRAADGRMWPYTGLRWPRPRRGRARPPALPRATPAKDPV